VAGEEEQADVAVLEDALEFLERRSMSAWSLSSERMTVNPQVSSLAPTSSASFTGFFSASTAS
jgi:hypothetical protein